jgi:enterochelin esterase family protein
MRFLILLFSASVGLAQIQMEPILSPRSIKAALEKVPDGAKVQELHDQVLRLFGRQSLLQGKPGTRIEGETVAWAVMDMKPAQVVRGDGTVIGAMTSLGEDGLQVLVQTFPNFTDFAYHIMIDGAPRVAGSVHIENYTYTADSHPQKGVPVGKLVKFEWRQSRVFPETVRDVTVYIPEQYKPGTEACLMVWQDGSRHVDPKGPMRAGVVFDNMIHQKKMPVTIGIFVDPGRKLKQKAGEKARNRSFEYDRLGDLYVKFLVQEILPEVQKRFDVKFRPEPEARAIAGGSSGGICAFTAAWERPDQFHKVLCWVGTFVDIHGGNVYPYLLRITERKPIRVYLLDGVNDLDNKYGNWPLANRMMEASLKYMDYDFRMDWTQSFHGSKGMAPALPEALQWLWRDVK